jgi:hypothetical protein
LIKLDPVGLRLKVRQPSGAASKVSFSPRQLLRVGWLFRHGPSP